MIQNGYGLIIAFLDSSRCFWVEEGEAVRSWPWVRGNQWLSPLKWHSRVLKIGRFCRLVHIRKFVCTGETDPSCCTLVLQTLPYIFWLFRWPNDLMKRFAPMNPSRCRSGKLSELGQWWWGSSPCCGPFGFLLPFLQPFDIAQLFLASMFILASWLTGYK